MIDIGPPRDERDWDQYASLSGQAFVGTADQSRKWIDQARAIGIVRVARDGGRLVGGATAYRVAQVFGGREVPAGAVADVCVAPERRGSGVAKALMAELTRAMRKQGFAVSPLWPSTTRLYRNCGWEVAGGEWRFRVPTHHLAGLRGAGEAVPDPGRAVRAMQRTRAADFDGPLVRPDWWWRWKHPWPVPDHTFRYAWVEDGAVTGFLTFRQTQTPAPDWGVGVEVMEFWTAGRNAAVGLLGFLGSHSAMTKEIHFHHAALPATPDIAFLSDLDLMDGGMFGAWMLRLVDVPAALEARGWPEDAGVRVSLEVQDPFADAPDRIVLEVEGGQAQATPGGTGDVCIGVGALSAWYSGYLRTVEAARLGLASGDRRHLASLDRLTGDRTVWLPDHF
jgi:predicted acetyltransferase